MPRPITGRPKPPQLTGGSRKGIPNKATKALKDMILGALSSAGGEAYLVKQARENPGPFLTLVGKVLPSEISGEGGGPVRFQAVCRIVAAKARDEGGSGE